MNADPSGKAHILIVDDDRMVLAALSRGLRDAGYQVSEASNGEDAFVLAEKEKPDLALLDVRMPGMDGIELGRMLQQKTTVPFLYLSAYGQPDIVKQAVEHGALGYLVKPLDIPQIVPEIEAALSRAAELKKLRESEGQLSAALAGSREISMAVGLLMMRDRLDRAQAFELLRSHARSKRRPVAEVAKELLVSAENLNAVSQLKIRTRRGKPRGA